MIPSNLASRITSLPKYASIIAASALLLGGVSSGASFTAGNLAVLKADSSSANNTTCTIVELDRTTAGQTPSNAISILGTGTNALRISGSAGSTGYLTTTDDKSLLCFTGGNSTNTASNVNTLNPRGVGTLNSSGTFALQTTYTGTSGNQTRGATSLNNSNWYVADQGGIYSNSTSTASPALNVSCVKSFGGVVYASQAKLTSFSPVVTITAVTGGSTVSLPGLSNNATTSSPNVDFYLISSGMNGTAYDVLYILNATSATVGSIDKFSLVSNSWTANGTYTTAFGGFSMAAEKNGNGANLYVTGGNGATAANSVIKLADAAGYNSTISITTGANVTLYTAPAGTIAKGISFAPIAPPVISSSDTLAAVNTTYGSGSASPTSFTLSGSNLTAGITVTPPAGFEVSQTSSSAGYAGSGTAIAVGSSGAVASTTVYVRLAATATVAGSPYSGNIVLSSSGATSVNIATVSSSVTAKALTITANNVIKNFNSTLTSGAGSTAFTSSGLVSPQSIGSVTITYGSGALASDTAGSYPGSVVASAVTGGTFTPSNYSISYIAGNITVNSAISLTISGLTADNKPYDRTTTATLSGTTLLVGVLAGDVGNVTVSGTPLATFASAGVGNGIAVTVNGYTLSGSAAGGYVLTQPTGLTANITAKALTVTGAAVTTKAYDGTANATITGTIAGVIAPDVVTFNGTGTFASLAIGNNIAVTSTSSIGGADVGNYSLTQPTGLTGNITTPTTVDLSRYVRVGRYDLPEPTRTTPPSGSLLCQEASNVTYNWDTDTLFLTGDGGTSVVQVSKTGALINSMTLALNSARRAGVEFDDTEGLTYIGNGEFVMTEERDRTLVKFTYVPNTTLQRSDTKTMKLGTTIGNIGLEGVCYDPSTNGFIVIKEKQPKGIFQTTVDWNNLTASNGSPTTINSTNLFDPELLNTLDLSDVFALSNLPALSGSSEASHLLVISQESGQIVNCDRSGNVYSRLTIVADAGSPLTVPAMTMEGVCMDRSGNLYITNEDGGGDFDHPQLWVYALSSAINAAPTAVTLTSVVSTLPQLPNIASDIRVADINVTDDGIGPNTLSISGTDAASFKIIGTALFLKAGTTLNAATKSTYTVTVNVDDTTVGATPDASTTHTLTISNSSTATPNLVITEVAPWSSSNSGTTLAADWFEVTNYGTSAIDLTGWTVDDNSNSYAVSLPVFGASSIAAGESVIFIETGIDSQAALDIKAAAFKTLWFGDNPPANLHFCGYSGSGVGLSTGGDAVNLFDIGGNVQAHVDFGANTGNAGKFYSFDNAQGLNNTTISNLSVVGVSGAFVAANDANEIGSPGTVGSGATPLVSIVATDASASETGSDPGTFRISRSGSTASTLTAIYSIATGTGQASAGDYTPTLSGSVDFAVGQAFVDITITPVDDALGEGTETLTLSITDTGSYDVGTSGSATISILDNDALNTAPTAIALANTVSVLSEAASTASNIRVADITVTDDGQGTNSLGVSGTDAAFFTVVGNSLYLKAGTTLSSTTKASYSVNVIVDDTTVGSTPDASTSFSLTIAAAVTPGSIIISEVAPWSSTSTASNGITADWFEVTNIGTTTANITNWKVDDNSHAYASAVPMYGVTSIAPGESVIFLETPAPLNAADLVTKAAAFRSTWFGNNPPAGLQIGGYSGSGVGLSSTADEVVLFDASGAIVSGVGFGVSPASAPFATFDNKAGAGGTTLPLQIIATASVVGTNGAFAAVNDSNEKGSPGSIATSTISFAASTATVNEALGSVTLTINRTGGTAPAFVTVNTANGTATAGTDYTAQSNVTVSFAANATTQTVSIPVINRPGIRANRTFTATLSSPSAGSLLGATTTETVTITEGDTYGAITGPSSSNTPYIQPLSSNWQVTSLLSAGDTVPLTGGSGSYQMAGIPDGVGAYDNGDGTFTMLVNHEFTNTTTGVVRAHGSKGAFVSEWIINKKTLAVVSGSDLIQSVYGWNTGTQSSDSTPSTFTFARFCSADLPAPSALYNAATGLGSQARIFLNGEESTGGGANGNGQALANVASGSDKGKTYILGKFVLTTNGSGLTGVGSWENLLANPYVQDKTVVIGNNDGGTGIMNNTVVVYVGTKTNTGTEADKAGLTNGTMKFINVTGSTAEIVNTTTRATNITSGTRFTLSGTSATTFSRPEDGAWDPTNLARYYFVTTDQLDKTEITDQTQKGRTRLWSLTFDDITNPDAGGVINLLIEGGGTIPAANDANMFDNITVTGDGKIMLCEDVGGADHNGKVWFFDPATNSLTKAFKHDPARFGDVVSGAAVAATTPFNNDEETSGVIDVTSIFGGNPATGERTFLIVDQAHYTTGVSTAVFEGGQLMLIKQAPTFLGIASGDADSSSAMVWAGYNKTTTGASINVQVATDSSFTSPTTVASSTPTAANGWISKVNVTGLSAGTGYFYRFVEVATSEVSATGKFKTAPAANAAYPLHFAFSGDNDGIMRPYPLASTVPALGLDFFVNLGDTIYENASVSTGNNGASWLNSPSVTTSGASNTTSPSSTGATAAQLAADYAKKYKENFLPVNIGGQNALKDFYAAQGNYTQFDNHELGNRQYINGGAPRGVAVGDFTSGAGVNSSDTANDVNTSTTGDYMNKSGGFQTLIQTYMNWMPVKEDRAGSGGLISAPFDSRTDGTHQFYFAQQWGKNAAYFNTDDRSYRDIRLKTSGNADDTGSRANNPNRTMLGVTQLAWLKSALLSAQQSGTIWKFVAVSDPIDQLGPIGGALTGSLSAVNSDGGKSWIGGYRAERNALLKYIADNHITNVVFLATDDHQNRINELTYSPSGALDTQSSYTKVPYCFSIVCGPLGATGPETITDHSFSNIKTIADDLATRQATAGLEPIGLMGYPGLKNLVRDGDATASSSPQAVDFYSPDTFNYTVFDVSSDGKTLSVTSKGIKAFAQNAALEYDSVNNPVRDVFSFQIDGAVSLTNWRQVHFGTVSNTGSAADLADADGDGIANLVEYALGIDPTVATGANGVAALPSVLSGDSNPLLGDRLALTFSLPNPNPIDITYVVQASADLTSWTDVASKTGSGAWQWLGDGTSHIVSSGSAPVTVKIGDLVPADASHPRRMMRLKVSIP